MTRFLICRIFCTGMPHDFCRMSYRCVSNQQLLNVANLPAKKVVHERHASKSRVIKNVSGCAQSPCLGLIDEDPGSRPIRMFSQFHKVMGTQTAALFAHQSNSNIQLIQLSPRLEDWLLRRTRLNNISLKSFNIPETAKGLYGLKIRTNRNYQNFISTLIEQDSEIKTISDWIQQLFK